MAKRGKYGRAWEDCNEDSYKGLSLMHNSPREADAKGGFSRGLSLAKDYTVTIAEGGRMLQLDGQSLTGFKGKMKPKSAIVTFSRRSRWELQKRMSVIDESAAGLPDFLTTTYPDKWSEDWRVWKRDLDVLNKAMLRRWPEMWGVWRLEFQKRGAPHFHYLLWDGPQVEGMKVLDGNSGEVKIIPIPGCMNEHNQKVFEWISEAWYRIVGSGDPKHLQAGTRVEPIQTWNGVVYYASKYLAKLPDGSFAPVDFTGRFWGVLGRKRWKTILHTQEVPEAVFHMLRRVLRKKREKVVGHKKYIEPDGGITDIGLKSDTGFKLLAWAYRSVREKGSDNLHAPF